MDSVKINFKIQYHFFQDRAQSSAYSQAQGSYSQRSQNEAEILRYENEITEDGFHYAYETSDGTKAEQEGEFNVLLK